jgi:hypothetical protein
MDLDDITKDLERIGLPQRPRGREPDLKARHGGLKALALRILAFILLAIVGGFGILVISFYQSTIMLLIVLVYFALGAYLAFKLFSLTYVGWLYTLLLSAAGVLMPVLALVSRGFSNPTLAMGAVAVMVVSLCSAALLWWAKDLFGIKSYHDVFMPYA